jgi:hypothetical protein
MRGVKGIYKEKTMQLSELILESEEVTSGLMSCGYVGLNKVWNSS